MNPELIYLDHAAATPLDPRVLTAMEPYLHEQFYNPSAPYRQAKIVQQALEQARSQCASWLGSRSHEIIFTAGATEANNLAVHGIMKRYPQASMIVLAIEHDSVLEPARCYKHAVAPVLATGLIDMPTLRNMINDDVVLVSCMYANNEIGTIQPIREISKLIQQITIDRLSRNIPLPLYLHSDAAQAANYLDLHVSRLGVDLLSLNGSKIYGPKQTGLLYVRAGLELTPLILGGGQERNLRSGTENVAGSIGLSVALDLMQRDRQTEHRRLGELQDFFVSEALRLPGVSMNGARHKRLPNNVHLTMLHKDNERLVYELDELGIMAATGSACSASDEEPSHVLKAIGLSDALARSSLRFSLGRSTTKQHIERTCQVLAGLCE
jgi:cysteine desulfurase